MIQLMWSTMGSRETRQSDPQTCDGRTFGKVRIKISAMTYIQYIRPDPIPVQRQAEQIGNAL